MIDDKRLAEMERGNAEFRGVTCDDVAALIAEVRRLREALKFAKCSRWQDGNCFEGPYGEKRQTNPPCCVCAAR